MDIARKRGRKGDRINRFLFVCLPKSGYARYWAVIYSLSGSKIAFQEKKLDCLFYLRSFRGFKKKTLVLKFDCYVFWDQSQTILASSFTQIGLTASKPRLFRGHGRLAIPEGTLFQLSCLVPFHDYCFIPQWNADSVTTTYNSLQSPNELCLCVFALSASSSQWQLASYCLLLPQDNKYPWIFIFPGCTGDYLVLQPQFCGYAKKPPNTYCK